MADEPKVEETKSETVTLSEKDCVDLFALWNADLRERGPSDDTSEEATGAYFFTLAANYIADL